MPDCNPKNIKSRDPAYECNKRTGRWNKKKPRGGKEKKKPGAKEMDLGAMSKKELLALPQARHIRGRHAMKIADLRRLLSGERDCKNDADILGDPIQEIPAPRFFRTSAGYCHDINVLAQYLISSSIRNIDPNDPYNRESIWNTEKEKKALWNHPGLDKSLKKELVRLEKQARIKPLKASHYPILEQMAEIGWLIWNDQPRSVALEGFEVSERLLVRLREIIEQSPDPGVWLNLRNGSDATTLQKELFETSHASCIHGKGVFLIKMYLYHYFHTFADSKPLHPLFQILAEKRVLSPLIKLDQLIDVLQHPSDHFLKPAEFYENRNRNAFVFTWVATNNVFLITPSYERQAQRLFTRSEQTWNEVVTEIITRYLF